MVHKYLVPMLAIASLAAAGDSGLAPHQSRIEKVGVTERHQVLPMTSLTCAPPSHWCVVSYNPYWLGCCR
jgi:hypothetical protein